MAPSSPLPSLIQAAVHPDQLLVVTAFASSQRWNSARDFILDLAIQIPGSLYKFIQVYSLPALHERQRFLLHCAAHSDADAKPSIGLHYDVATAIITKAEDSNWKAAVVQYVGKGEQLEEALSKLRSAEVPFNGSSISTKEITKEKTRRQRFARKRKMPVNRGQAQPSLKRKRNLDEAIKGEASRLAKTARNAGQKYTITDDDKKLLARHLAKAPREMSWEDSLFNFVEHKEGAGRWSYPTWATLRMPNGAGIKLWGASPTDMELLSSLLEDLKDLKLEFSKERKVVVAAQSIISDVLRNDLGNPMEERADDEDASWGEDWGPDELFEWILDIVRGYVPQSEKRDHIVLGLENRLASASASPWLSQESDSGYDLSGSPSASGPGSGATPGSPSTPRPPPISLLPVELLQEVFELACLGQTTSPLTPFHISRVNTYFRSIALEMKPIWTCIDDVLPIPIANLYLDRSGDCPLNFRIGAGYPRDRSRTFTENWLHILAKHCNRVQVLEVETSDIVMMREWAALQDEYHCCFRSLRKFNYILHKRSKRGEDSVMCPIWVAFPDLRDLWIQGCWISGWVSTSDPFPPTLQHLKVSDIAELRIGGFARALQAIPQLATLIIDDIQELPTTAGTSPLPSQVVTLEHLKELELSRIAESDMMTLCAHLSTPALSSLSASFSRSPDTGGSDFLPNFTKTHPNIESLDISYSTMTSACWTSVLENLPDLKILRTCACHLTGDDLQMLTAGHNLSRLTKLTFDNELRLSTLFVEQVVRTHPALKSVVLRGWDSSNVSTHSLDAMKQHIQHLYVETLRTSPKDFGQTESENESDCSNWDSESDEGWLSGDEAVVSGKC
ncbi:hypothetical protein FRC04_009415 [Tulasnella sp. 424]|nr:hypothetical protein FRC04_009415 [Tulasnella sp. 424]